MTLPVLLAALLVAAADPTAAELLDRGDALLADLEYEQAAEELMRAASAPDATEDQRLEAHLKAGIANRIIGRDVDARLNFRTVLLARPATRLPPGTSPKVLSFFEGVRRELELEREKGPSAPAPDARSEPLHPVARALVAGGVTAGVGVLTLPVCGYCGSGLCILCPGTCAVAVGALAGGLVGTLVAREPIFEGWAPVAAAAGAAVVVTGLVGGGVYALALVLSPETGTALGNGSFNEVADAAGLAGGVVAAVLAGAAAGVVTWAVLPSPAEPAPPPGDTQKKPPDPPAVRY